MTKDNERLLMNANKVVDFLKKDPLTFTKADIIRYIRENGVRMVNFLYPGGDGKLKTLGFVINDLYYLDTILTSGERVDGSSLFGFIKTTSSDLYVIPRFSTAFMDPFAPPEIPALDLLCSFFDKDGRPLESAPERTLSKAQEAFGKATGMEFQAMGELEYYVILDDDGSFPATDQHGYHESAPYCKTSAFRAKCMDYISRAGGQIKYGHSEVGNFRMDGKIYEQNEIEFLPVRAETAAENILLAKWIIRRLAHMEGYNVTFAPKITVGKAGSGMHVHMRLMKDGKSMMTGPDGELSAEARKAIAGMMDLAEGITAFGNKNPMSYFRLVPHQEAPTSICWGYRNRAALVRVPLGWSGAMDMCSQVNPFEQSSLLDLSAKQTVEMRSPDGSADIYQLLSGLCVACRHGFEMKNALSLAKKTYVEPGGDVSSFRQLPDSCAASADCLERQRGAFEEQGVFNPEMIDEIIAHLRSFGDRTLRSDIEGDTSSLQTLVDRYFHCG